ncbi:RNA polymerase sigma-70 factor [Neobacillus niacini]|uniref:RNA polymerase sigma-70 factor n=1 Tax=Neobacillus niacini TaxID=86668 RepID=UPI0021CAF293|nr:RNA polymerase sigma-70 factor [Neobacillus niacini]MCM3768685.1 RNA polymerase sigma-70 factor [Neobacillus niacini]
MVLDELYQEYKSLLFSIAYRMLGTVSDAEDIIQDVFLRAGEVDLAKIDNKKAYLCKMVTNACLDYLKSARKKREVYIGPWLPEPLLVQENDPYGEVVKGELVSFAALLLFEKLTPIERAVFILREVLEYEYQAVAEIVGRTETTCRKIYSRVKKKLPGLGGEEIKANHDRKEEIIGSFLSAIFDGNASRLEHLLSEDVILYSDGGGKTYAAIRPIHSREFVVRFIESLTKQLNSSRDKTAQVQIIQINGQTGVVAVGLDNVMSVISFHVLNDQIQEIYVVRNPEKLKHL